MAYLEERKASALLALLVISGCFGSFEWRVEARRRSPGVIQGASLQNSGRRLLQNLSNPNVAAELQAGRYVIHHPLILAQPDGGIKMGFATQDSQLEELLDDSTSYNVINVPGSAYPQPSVTHAGSATLALLSTKTASGVSVANTSSSLTAAPFFYSLTSNGAYWPGGFIKPNSTENSDLTLNNNLTSYSELLEYAPANGTRKLQASVGQAPVSMTLDKDSNYTQIFSSVETDTLFQTQLQYYPAGDAKAKAGTLNPVVTFVQAVVRPISDKTYLDVLFISNATCVKWDVTITGGSDNNGNNVQVYTDLVEGLAVTNISGTHAKEDRKLDMTVQQSSRYDKTTYDSLDKSKFYKLFTDVTLRGGGVANSDVTVTVRLVALQGNCGQLGDNFSALGSWRSNTSDGGVNTGAIVGGVVGGVAAIAIVTLAGMFIILRRKHVKAAAANDADPAKLGEFLFNPYKSYWVKEASDASDSNEANSRVTLTDISVLRTEKAAEINLTSTMMLNTGTNPLAVQNKDNTSTVCFKTDVSNISHASNESSIFSIEKGQELQSLWLIDPKNLKIKKREGGVIKLGAGGSGSVYLGEMFGTTEVAMKHVNRPSAEQLDLFAKEIMLLKACSFHPNIVQFLGACMGSNSDSQALLVMEYLPEGDLYHKMKVDKYGALRWNKLGKPIALGIAKGLSYLHANGIVHLDIKSPNILLTNDMQAKISDIGLGMKTDGLDIHAAGGASFAWSSPEQLVGDPCGTASDMYALGVVLYEICTGETPAKRIMRRLKSPEDAPQCIIDLFQACTSQDPSQRPTAAEAYRRIASSSLASESSQLSSPPA